MNSEIIIILKNFRYNLIKMDNQYMIIDKDKPVFLIFFLPFIYWFFPKRVMKISRERANDLQTIANAKVKTGKGSLVGAGIALILANLISPFLDYLDVALSPLITYFIILLITILLVTFRLIVSGRNKKSLLQQLDDTEPQGEEILWVIPKRIKECLLLLLFTVFIWAFIIGSIAAFVIMGNLFMLFLFTLCLFILLFLNITCILPGENTMKIRIKGQKFIQ